MQFYPMADVHEPEVRSYNMSRIKGKDTKPEILVRKWLHAQGWDPYLEDIGTIYLLHYLLTTKQKEYSAYLLFEHLRNEKPEFN